MQENKPECQGCAVQRGYVPVETLSAEIKEPAQIKPSMSMHVSVEDYQRALAEWEAEQPKDCARSHPHEQMNQMCELRTEIARLTNKLARTEAQLAAVQQGVQPVATITGVDEFGPMLGWHEHWVNFKAGTNLYTHPTQQGLDAQRWKIVRNHISGEYIAGRACFVVRVEPVHGANIMRGSVAEHFTKAVDDRAKQIKIADQAWAAAQAKHGGV